MKRIFAFLATLVIAIGCLAPNAAAITFTPSSESEISAQAYYLYNTDASECVASKNENERIDTGYLAMIMTAIITAEKIPDLNTSIICKNYSSTAGLPSADFRDGEKTTVRDCLYAMLLYNSCQEAMLVADYICEGDVSGAFVELMNRRAKELGAVNTNFVDPFGGDDDNQYTTAKDMAMIYKYAVSLSSLKEILSTYERTLSVEVSYASTHGTTWTIWNKNGMLKNSSAYYCDYLMNGIVSCTEYGGCSMAVQASRGGNTYIAVVLNAPLDTDDNGWYCEHYNSCRALLDWAMNYVSYEIILSSDDELAEVPVEYAEGDGYVIAKTAEDYIGLWCAEYPKSELERKITYYNEYLIAPVEKGTALGKMELYYKGECLFDAELVAGDTVERSEIGYSMKVVSLFLKSKQFETAKNISLIFFGVTLLIFISVRIYQALCQKKCDEAWEAEKRRHSAKRSSTLKKAAGSGRANAQQNKKKPSLPQNYDVNAAFDEGNTDN
ncbi:MAG: D-alanyl-D-alanine carboxypeptidase [Oscillospiraceae bacterium]|nr:D-alanyl-D-alanine carboxypeptidase [Oscillospiraceae bacterium]